MFPALVDSVSNHVKPYWPAEATTASDSEDLGGAERLRVETKVNVELHQENKLNHTGERERDTQQEREKPASGNGRDTAPPNQQNSHSNHHPEQRKGRVDDFLGLIKVIMQFYFNWHQMFVFLRHPEEQDQLPSPAERQKHEKPSEREAERLQLPHHHLSSPHQQPHLLTAAPLFRQHHLSLFSAFASRLQRWGSARQPRQQLTHQNPRSPETATCGDPAGGRLPGEQRGNAHALEVGDGQRRKRVWLRVSVHVIFILLIPQCSNQNKVCFISEVANYFLLELNS